MSLFGKQQQVNVKSVTLEEMKNWKNKITAENISEIFKKRQTKTSCAHDLYRLWSPQGLIRYRILKIFYDRITSLERNGTIKKVRKDTCPESDLSHTHYRIKLDYDSEQEKPEEQPQETIKTIKKRGKKRMSKNRKHSKKNLSEFDKKILVATKERPDGFYLSNFFRQFYNLNGTKAGVRKNTAGKKYSIVYHSILNLFNKGYLTKRKEGNTLFFKPTDKNMNEEKFVKSRIPQNAEEKETTKIHVSVNYFDKDIAKRILDSNLSKDDKLILVKLVL